MAEQQTVIFTHIQKTAGTTFGRLLKIKYGMWPPANLLRLDLAMGLHYYHYHGDFPSKRVVALRELADDQKRKIRLVQGHMSFGVHEFFSHPCQYITVIRDPINRVLSHYHQIKQQNWFPYKDEIRSMSLEEFIQAQPIDALSNYQVKMLAGVNAGVPGDLTPYGCSPADADLLKSALRNIAERYLVVVTERFDESLLLLKRKLGWLSAQYIKSNVTKSRKKRADYAEPVIDLIREHNELDIELYEQAARRVNSEIDSLGPEFQREVASFRKSNDLLNRLFYVPIDRSLKLGRKMHAAKHRDKMSPRRTE